MKRDHMIHASKSVDKSEGEESTKLLERDSSVSTFVNRQASKQPVDLGRSSPCRCCGSRCAKQQHRQETEDCSRFIAFSRERDCIGRLLPIIKPSKSKIHSPAKLGAEDWTRKQSIRPGDSWSPSKCLPALDRSLHSKLLSFSPAIFAREKTDLEMLSRVMRCSSDVQHLLDRIEQKKLDISKRRRNIGFGGTPSQAHLATDVSSPEVPAVDLRPIEKATVSFSFSKQIRPMNRPSAEESTGSEAGVSKQCPRHHRTISLPSNKESEYRYYFGEIPSAKPNPKKMFLHGPVDHDLRQARDIETAKVDSILQTGTS